MPTTADRIAAHAARTAAIREKIHDSPDIVADCLASILHHLYLSTPEERLALRGADLDDADGLRILLETSGLVTDRTIAD